MTKRPNYTNPVYTSKEEIVNKGLYVYGFHYTSNVSSIGEDEDYTELFQQFRSVSGDFSSFLTDNIGFSTPAGGLYFQGNIGRTHAGRVLPNVSEFFDILMVKNNLLTDDNEEIVALQHGYGFQSPNGEIRASMQHLKKGITKDPSF